MGVLEGPLSMVDDLLVLSFTLDGEKLFDLESVRRVISGFIDKEKSLEVFSGGGGFKEAPPSMAMQKVANMVDAYLGEIATYTELSISKFNGIANLVPKAARKVDDHLYRSIDIYLKAHPGLDEIEREKVCSVMDPFKLSYEARVHASQNKRLPVQIVLHALYYDQLKLRSGGGGGGDVNTIVEKEKNDGTLSTRTQLQADVSLVKENEELRTELMKMKLHISYLQKSQLQHRQLQGDRGSTTSSSSSFSSTTSNRHVNLFYSVSKKLGKLKNSFRHGSKDTLNMDDDDDDAVDVTATMPRRGRRFSIS